MRRLLPVFTLFVLAPVVAEVLLGATPISRIGGLIPLSLLYGGGAVLIRELGRRCGGGWWRIALLGAAYGIVEEGLAIQSLFNPDLFQAGLLGGRALGVNWVWSEWTVGYHMLWSILLPILLAELLFPAHRAQPWLGRAGVAIAAGLYALGLLFVGAIFRRFVAPGFSAPPVLMACAGLLAACLAAVALAWPGATRALGVDSEAMAPSAGGPPTWRVSLVVLAAAVAWFGLFALPDALRVFPWVVAPMAADVVLAAGTANLLARWSRPGRPWTDRQRLAIVLGALPVSLAFSFVVTRGSPVDQLGQAGVGLAVGLLLGAFGWRLHRRERVPGPSAPSQS